MTLLLSFLPCRWLQHALRLQWENTLTKSERARLGIWGATGNAEHHPFAWADNLP